MDKQTVVYLHNGILISNKKDKMTASYSNMNLKNISPMFERPYTKRACTASIYIKLKSRPSYPWQQKSEQRLLLAGGLHGGKKD